ncbi:MAG: hypothetical protein ABFC89_08080 [Methanospirillum sp.]
MTGDLRQTEIDAKAESGSAACRMLGEYNAIITMEAPGERAVMKTAPAVPAQEARLLVEWTRRPPFSSGVR